MPRSARSSVITFGLSDSGQNGGTEAYRLWGASAQKLKLMMFKISLEGLNGNDGKVERKNKLSKEVRKEGGAAGRRR